MDPKAQHLEDLEAVIKMGCSTPNCTHDHSTLYLHGRCHPDAKVEVSYTQHEGVLRVNCAVCLKPIAVVAVASRAALN